MQYDQCIEVGKKIKLKMKHKKVKSEIELATSDLLRTGSKGITNHSRESQNELIFSSQSLTNTIKSFLQQQSQKQIPISKPKSKPQIMPVS
jgi:hypothetical protein